MDSLNIICKCIIINRTSFLKKYDSYVYYVNSNCFNKFVKVLEAKEFIYKLEFRLIKYICERCLCVQGSAFMQNKIHKLFYTTTLFYYYF